MAPAGPADPWRLETTLRVLRPRRVPLALQALRGAGAAPVRHALAPQWAARQAQARMRWLNH
eukprot:374135-Lingulodinium_polyedra.AAC.1